nr:hypothetical protein [Candidatus Brocadiia bacterium]
MSRPMAALLTVLAQGLGLLALADANETRPVECLRTGEGAVVGRLISVEGDTLTLRRGQATEALPLEGFREIVFDGPPVPTIPPPWTVWAGKSGRFMLRRIEAGDEAETVDLIGYGWKGEGLALGSVRALAARSLLQGPTDRLEEFRRARDDPPGGEDLLMLARGDRRHLIACAVEEMTAAGVTVSVGQARRTVPWTDLRWLVLSPAAPQAEDEGHLVELADGTLIRLRSFELRDGTLTGEGRTARYSIAAGRPARIRIRSDAYRYLSDVEPERTSLQPLLDVVWPPRSDRAVTGGPLSLGGR